MKFIIFVIDDGTNSDSESEMAQINSFNNQLRLNRNWVTAAGIESSNSVKQIDNRDDKNQSIEGSLVSSKENYTGFWIVEAEDFSKAEGIAKNASKACNRKVEIRSYLS